MRENVRVYVIEKDRERDKERDSVCVTRSYVCMCNDPLICAT